MNPRKKLVAHLISLRVDGGLTDAIRFLMSRTRLAEAAKTAEADVNQMIAAVRKARDAKKSWTDDYICERILAGLKKG